MICEECGKTIRAYPCKCGYGEKKMEQQTTHMRPPWCGPPAGASWIIQHCLRPGCTTAIRTRTGLPEAELVCKWCRATDDHGCPFAVSPSHLHHDPT